MILPVTNAFNHVLDLRLLIISYNNADEMSYLLKKYLLSSYVILNWSIEERLKQVPPYV